MNMDHITDEQIDNVCDLMDLFLATLEEIRSLPEVDHA